jgi:hypothetical protein
MRALTNPLFYILVSVLTGLFACQQQPDDSVQNLDQIRPKSHTQTKKTTTTKALDTLSSFLKTYANDSCSLKMAAVFLDSSQNKHFLNRFSKQHFHVLCQDSLKQLFGHQEWSFKDTNQAKEAFFNWLDQFKSKQPFKIGSTEKIFKDYTLIALAGNQIVQVSSPKKIKYEDWLRFWSGHYKNANFSYILWAQPKKNTKWYRFKNAQLLTL